MNLHRAIIAAALVLGGGSLLAACGEGPNVSTPAAAPNAARPARAPITTHIVVQRGQSLRRIAKEYRVAERDIIAANHLVPPYTLKPGTILTIAVAAAEPTYRDKPAPKPGRAARAPGRPDHESPVAKPTKPANAGSQVSPEQGDVNADQASRR
jgi:LysM repeat protein